MSTICRAIAEKKYIQFQYDGGRRVVEPHCYGISTAENHVLRAYQVSGYSQSGNPKGWKLFDIAKASQIEILPESFEGPRRGYDRFDDAMSQIFCRL